MTDVLEWSLEWREETEYPWGYSLTLPRATLHASVGGHWWLGNQRDPNACHFLARGTETTLAEAKDRAFLVYQAMCVRTVSS